MRQLKFRAWAKTGYMFHVNHISWNRKGGLEYVRGERFDGQGMIGGHEGYINMGDIVLMQFIGMKDNTKWDQLTRAQHESWRLQGGTEESWDGVEIFEGDIIKFHWGEGQGYAPEATEMIDEVIFRDGCFYFVNHDIDGGAFAFRHNSHCEVIGNRWENPELLEEK